jgi:hypothetical protein
MNGFTTNAVIKNTEQPTFENNATVPALTYNTYSHTYSSNNNR